MDSPILSLLFIFSCFTVVALVTAARLLYREWDCVPPQKRRHTIKIGICLAIFLAAFMNGGAYMTIGLAIGGAAVVEEGRDYGNAAEEGQYWLMSHGNYTEVSRDVWLYSYYHGRIARLTFFAGLASFGIMCFGLTGPKQQFLKDLEEDGQREP